MLDIDKIKYHLRDTAYITDRRGIGWRGHSPYFILLEDMTGPTVLNLGRCIVAKSRVVDLAWDEVEVAISLREQYDFMAYYATRVHEPTGQTILRYYAGTFEQLKAEDEKMRRKWAI